LDKVKRRRFFALYKRLGVAIALFAGGHISFAYSAGSAGSNDDIGFEKPSEFELERMAPRTDLEMLSTNLAGENISLADGGLSFSNTDVSVPTGMAIPAMITRTYQRLSGMNDVSASAFGDWKIDIPRIESAVLFGDSRNSSNYYPETACTYLFSPGSVIGASGQTVEQGGYWNGATLSLVNENGGKLLQGIGGYKTNNDTKVSCETAGDNTQYFVAKTATGLQYEFKQRKIISGFPLMRKFKSVGRGQLQYLVTKITDRFDNQLEYNYTVNKLTSISLKPSQSSYSRPLINIAYTDNVISSITANGQVWQYGYDEAHNQHRLTSVTQPDQRKWLYDFPFFHGYAPKFEIENTTIFQSDQDKAQPGQCKYVAMSNIGDAISITHPHGATATYHYSLKVHGKTEVPADKMNRGFQSSSPIYNINSCYATIAINKKTLSVNNETYTWLYDFSNNVQHWNIDRWLSGELSSPYNFNLNNTVYGSATTKQSFCDANAECSSIPQNLGYEPLDLRVLKVTEPDGGFTKHYISKRWDHTEGKVVATQTLNSAGELLNTTKKQFAVGIFKGDAGLQEESYSTNVAAIHYQAHPTSQKEVRNGDTYTIDFLSYNTYGALLQLKSYNSFSNHQRHIKMGYQHDTTNYLLNMPTTKQVASDGSNWKTTSETSYYNATSSYKSLPYQQKMMGNLLRTYESYHADGNVKRIGYQGTSRYELYEDYKLGKAQRVTLPCATTNGCDLSNSSTNNTVVALMSVDDDGTVASIADFKGHITNYSYDASQRLTKVDHLDSNWADTLISYQQTSDNFLQQTVSKGNYKKRTYLDGLLRPVYIVEEDITSTAHQKHVRQQFDHNNQIVFSSYPSKTSVANTGLLHTYDALGRAIKTTTTEGNITTHIQYLANNEIKVTNPNNFSTTTAYLAYGAASQKQATEIRSPESVNTSIRYNVLGQVTEITQGGITEKRIYDELGQHCKTVRPDVGVTAFGYNVQRQPIWQFNGSEGNQNSCAISNANRAVAASITYNNQGNIWTQRYSDSTPQKSFHYDENGQVKQLTAGSVVWDYDYDSLGNITREQLDIDDKIFTIERSYNSLGHVNSITYPSSRTITLSPNALGQETKVGSFASDISYSPTGQVTKMTLGNGVVKQLTLDIHQRPMSIRDSFGSQSVLNYDITYDDNNNVLSQTDNVTTANSISGLSYDGLDRLISARGKWGDAHFEYDDLGNITKKTLGNSSLHYNYENNRLTSTSGRQAKLFSYDSRGNVTNNGTHVFNFNRLNQVSSIDAIDYLYDGHDRRVKISKASSHKYSVYSQQGQLLHQFDTSNGRETDHIYGAGKLIATVTNNFRTPDITATGYGVGQGNIDVTWQGVHSATRYDLEERKNNGSWVSVYSGPNLNYSTQKTHTGDYQYRVKACKSDDCSSFNNSNNVSVLVKPAMPGAISSPTGIDQDGAYSISWSASDTATSHTLRQSVNGGGWTTVSTTSGTSKSFSGRGSASYRYAVRACNTTGCSGYRYSSTFYVLKQPASITYGVKDHDGGYVVNWSSVSSATSYQLQQQSGSGAWTSAYTGSGTSASMTGRADGYYKYRVRACRSGICTTYRQGSHTLRVIRPNLTINWSKTILVSPGYSLLTWSAIGADYCSSSLLGNNLLYRGLNNQFVSSTTTVNMTCYFGSQSISKSAKVTVKYGGGGGGVDF